MTSSERVKLHADIEKAKISLKGEPLSALEAWKGMLPGTLSSSFPWETPSARHKRRPRLKVFTNKTLVENWLSALRKAFNNTESELYGCERLYKKIAAYWLKHGRHDPASSDPDSLNAQRLWDGYIKKFARVTDNDIARMADDYIIKVVKLKR